MSKLISTNPGRNYEVIGEVEISTEDEIKEKVKKAHLAKQKWQDLGVGGRVEILRKVSEEIKNRAEELFLLITREMGIPISLRETEINDALRYFNWYLDNAEKYLSEEIVYEDDKIAHTVSREPLGVAAVVVPWNYPLANFVWGAAQNLVSGNTVVLKHSEECPLTGKLLEEIINKYLPEGVFSEVYGDGKVGDLLIHQDINLISFTGSTTTGKYIYEVAAEKFIKVILECGGSAPGVIFEDVDLDRVLETIYFDRFYNCGQSCDALKRLIVHKSRFDEVVERLKTFLDSKKVGDPQDKETEIGPLVAKRQLDLLEEQVKDAIERGAKVITGGKKAEGLEGAYFEPTILTNITKDMRVWQEEVFGPVLSVISFETENEAIELANDTQYGLGAYLFTEDKEKAKRVALKIEAGNVSINNASYLQPCSPFGGYKQSGLGREHGRYGFEELTQIKVVAMEK